MTGTLFVVATPIGNLEDITLRALRTLREATWIACEDTRRTAILLAKHGIEGELISCHEHNERRAVSRILDALARGEDVALVTDAGTPGIADPGAVVVRAAREAGVRVTPIPGPSAIAAAASVSAFPMDSFFFAGFLPAKAGARKKLLASLRDLPHALVFYEAPHRIAASLKDLRESLGDREALLGRELTKIHEEFRRGALSMLERSVSEGEPRGEYVLVVEGHSKQPESPAKPEEERVLELMRATGMERRDAERQVAAIYGTSRKKAGAWKEGSR